MDFGDNAMGKRIKLEGKKIHHWNVLEYTGLVERKAYYKCVCDCGRCKEIRSDSLLDGRNPECSKNCEYNKNSLTGKTFGRLIVLDHSHANKQSKHFWKCLCQCGNECVVEGYSLTHEVTKSCGCLHSEVARDILEKKARPSKIPTGIILKCEYCGDDIYRTPSNTGKSEHVYCSMGCRAQHQSEFIRGENHHAFIKDRSKLKPNTGRNSTEDRDWRIDVFERDSFTCQCCGEVGGKLNAHHLKSYSRFSELRYEADNGVTLCKSCHKEFHAIYGVKRFTSDDYYEFLVEKGVYCGK